MNQIGKAWRMRTLAAFRLRHTGTYAREPLAPTADAHRTGPRRHTLVIGQVDLDGIDLQLATG